MGCFGTAVWVEQENAKVKGKGGVISLTEPQKFLHHVEGSVEFQAA